MKLAVSALFNKLRIRIACWTDSLLWKSRVRQQLSDNPSIPGIAIGVTTFMDRFEPCFKSLLKRLVSLFPENRILVLINGHYRTEEHKAYLERVEAFCARFPSVEVISYTKPAGLSSLWNRAIKESGGKKIILLNDDLRIRSDFRSFLARSGILASQIATINNSWSHFLISGGIADTVGYFDEGLTEIGGEDDDYLARMAMKGLHPENYITSSLKKSSHSGKVFPAINSYGRFSADQEGGYSTLNTKYIRSKWITSEEYFEGAVEVKGRKFRYWKPRTGIAAGGISKD